MASMDMDECSINQRFETYGVVQVPSLYPNPVSCTKTSVVSDYCSGQMSISAPTSPTSEPLNTNACEKNSAYAIQPFKGRNNSCKSRRVNFPSDGMVTGYSDAPDPFPSSPGKLSLRCCTYYCLFVLVLTVQCSTYMSS